MPEPGAGYHTYDATEETDMVPPRQPHMFLLCSHPVTLIQSIIKCIIKIHVYQPNIRFPFLKTCSDTSNGTLMSLG